MKNLRSLVSILVFTALIVATFASSTTATAQAKPVAPVVVMSNVQAQDPIEFESARLLVENMKQLGLQVEHKAIPWEQQSDVVWYSRDKDAAAGWQVTGWRMVARPERMDPDEFVFNLFHSSTAEKGYNFVGYINPKYDALAEAQRGEPDRDKRRKIIFDAQDIIANDVPYIFVAHPRIPFVVRADVWNADTVVDAQGIGARNFWTMIGLTPTGSQKSIIVNTSLPVKAINPLYISGDADSRVTELIWDRLMRIGPDGLAKPWAAESVKWEDNKNVVVKLRSGMMWHDGKPVTAEDVKFSFEVPQTGESPMYAPFSSRVTKIEIVDPSTLRFTLKEPWAAFEVASLAKINLIPKHIWEPEIERLKKSDKENAENFQEKMPIGSGPFKFVAWQAGESIILEANTQHFSAPKAERWIMRIVPNAESVLGQLQTGEINFMTEFDGDATVVSAAVEADKNLKMFASPDLGFRFFAFNLRLDPFKDVAMRRAVAHVFPRDAVIKNIYKGFAVPADSYVSLAIDFWHNPNLPKYEFSIEKAKKVLSDAGYTWDSSGKLLMPAGK
ncbi:MAG: twin-arginine translocation pathway signal protein [Anaerolineae bacterium]|nr:twin-arginine translocation pathway signal protein [Anaerolineae bacterium]